MSEMLSKGDIVRSPRGYLASVNWCDGTRVGCSFIERSFPSLACMTYELSEVFVVKRGPEQFWKEMFKKISDEELRYQIREERAMRNVPPTEEQRVVRKRDNVKSLLKELSSEDQKALEEFIRMKKERE